MAKNDDHPRLPIGLIASILTYNLSNTKDLAELRLIDKVVSQQVREQLLSLERYHQIRWPERRYHFHSFVCNIDWKSYGLDGVSVGDNFVVPGHEISLIASDVQQPSSVEVNVVGVPKFPHQIPFHATRTRAAATTTTTTTTDMAFNGINYLERLRHVCESLMHATTLEQLISDDSNDMMFFEPPPSTVQHSSAPSEEAVASSSSSSSSSSLSSTAAAAAAASQITAMIPQQSENEVYAIPAMAIYAIDPSAHYSVRVNDTTYYRINMVNATTTTPADKIPFFQPLYSGGQVWAVDFGVDPDSNDDTLRLVRMLLYLKADAYRMFEQGESMRVGQSLLLQMLWEEYQQHRQVEGVIIVDDFIGAEARDLVNSQLDDLAQRQEREHAVVYQPDSNRMVRFLVNPDVVDNVIDAAVDDLCRFPDLDQDDDSTEHPHNTNFWGRPYEELQYQCLPTYVSISDNGNCTFDTYIGNLTPRDDPLHVALYQSLEDLLRSALPFMESAFSYVYALRPLLRHQDYAESEAFDFGPNDVFVNVAAKDDDPYNFDPILPMNIKSISLRGHQLQVFTKIVDYELSPQHDTYEGLWQVQGVNQEEILLTCACFLDRDNDIEGGEIEFMRAFLKDEAEYIYSNGPQGIRPPQLDTFLAQGFVPLGTVATPKGRLVIFPNSHIHRVKAMKLMRRYHSCSNEQQREQKRRAVVATQRIVVFLVVNPEKRIVSTREVPPQQSHSIGIATAQHSNAMRHRQALMVERGNWNVRPIDLSGDH